MKISEGNVYGFNEKQCNARWCRTGRIILALIFGLFACKASAQPTLTYTTGLQVWLKASAGVTTNGGVVTNWASQVGTASASSDTGAPTLVTNAIHGQPVVRFNGTSDALKLNLSATIAGPYTFFIVLANNTNGNTSGAFAGRSDSGWAPRFYGGRLELWPGYPATPAATGNLTVGASGTYISGIVNPPSGGLGSTLQAFQNGVQILPTAANPSGYTETIDIYSGARLGGDFASQFYKGDIAEVLIYNQALTTANMQLVHNYLTAKYSVRPSILFCMPEPLSSEAGFVDLNYLTQLYNQGYDVDYTTSFDDLTWALISQFNVLVVYQGAGCGYNQPGSVMDKLTFDARMQQYVTAGGGLFLMVPEQNEVTQIIDPGMISPWGLQIPAERMTESNQANLAYGTHLTNYQCAYTTNINASSPVSAGVSAIWYPYWNYYNAQATNPLSIDGTWIPVVSATSTTTTKEINFTNPPLNNPLTNPVYYPTNSGWSPSTGDPVSAPPIFAVRPATGSIPGRMAAISTLPYYSVGGGTTWYFNNDILSGGLNGKPSNFGQLLLNTFNWLAQPSQAGSTLGGYVTNPTNLLPPNDQPGQVGLYPELSWTPASLQSQFGTPPSGQFLAKGLIGAKTSYSNSSYSTVQAYANAVTNLGLGLSFIVFADDFTALNGTNNLTNLVHDCAFYSTPSLQLYPGYNITTNIGNRVFIFGPANNLTPITLPPTTCLTGTGNNQLNIQAFNTYTELPTDGWLFTVGQLDGNNVGYYDFTDGELAGGTRMQDGRNYTMAALKYYRAGRLVEDKTTSEYLPTAASTFPPGPVAFNEVTQATGNTGGCMDYEVNNNALTYARINTGAGNLTNLWSLGLFWTSQYNGPNLFESNGPIINAWTNCFRDYAYGGEEYVAGRMVMPALADVSAATGTTLANISIYNGSTLFRSFTPAANTTHFSQLLLLEAGLQQDLVLIATDNLGNQATSYALRSWKDSSGVSCVFCSDHVSDCVSFTPILLAFGPNYVGIADVPSVANPGPTWDGGPAANNIIFHGVTSAPILTNTAGTTENGNDFNQTPRIDFCDEQAGGYTSVHDHIFASDIFLIDSYDAFGPTMPSITMDFTETTREWARPTIGPQPTGWGATAQRVGVQPFLYTDNITFQENQTLSKLVVLTNVSGNQTISPAVASACVGGGQPLTVKRMDQLSAPWVVHLATGDWFGFFGASHNLQMFINRGNPVVLYVGNPSNANTWTDGSDISLEADLSISNPAVTTNTTWTYELLSMSYSLDSNATTLDSTELSNMYAYLNAPTGLTIQQGTQVASTGMLQFQNTTNYVSELTITAPPVPPASGARPSMTLPARMTNLMPNWSAWFWLKQGYEKGDYGNGINRYTPMGVGSDGIGYFPVQVTWAPTTHIEVGHPIVSSNTSPSITIQVTHISDSPETWHVDVNNTGTTAVTTTLSQQMSLPGLNFSTQQVTIQPGQYISLVN